LPRVVWVEATASPSALSAARRLDQEPAATMGYLTARNGPLAGSRFPLEGEVAVLGRHPDCDIVLDDGAVSRHHAQLARRGAQFVVEDLNSRNGTFVNNQLVRQPQSLAHGDEIRICDLAFTFHEGSPATEGQPLAVVIDDDAESTIMSKLDLSTSDGSHIRLETSPEVRLKALLEISRSLSRTLSLDQVLPQVLESLFVIFVQADRGLIVLRDEHGNLVSRWTKARHEEDERTIRLSRTVVRQVMSTKQAILSADAASDQRFDMSQSVTDFRIRSMICAPLIDSDGEAFGVLQLDTLERKKRFRPEDLEVLASVASQASTAIENAKLHESMLRQRDLERDLALARQVQQRFLPARSPDIPGYEFFDYYRPANQVGGDYFDYVPLPHDRLVVAIADVVGHNLAAALLMAKFSATLRFALASESSLAEALERTNQTLARDDLDDCFVTIILAELNIPEGELTIANAGHNPPLQSWAGGRVEALGEDIVGVPLLVKPSWHYHQKTVQLEKDSTVLFYTDGLSELNNPAGELFGIERIRQTIALGGSAEATGKAVLDAAERFAAGRALADDMCLVLLSRHATGPSPHETDEWKQVVHPV
jgi:serine phosphatase RsbU (regulator of sigma subunit)/pSer/pThr/pTyr-binding forkhead associated (FHA) protein